MQVLDPKTFKLYKNTFKHKVISCPQQYFFSLEQVLLSTSQNNSICFLPQEKHKMQRELREESNLVRLVCGSFDSGKGAKGLR